MVSHTTIHRPLVARFLVPFELIHSNGQTRVLVQVKCVEGGHDDKMVATNPQYTGTSTSSTHPFVWMAKTNCHIWMILFYVSNEQLNSPTTVTTHYWHVYCLVGRNWLPSGLAKHCRFKHWPQESQKLAPNVLRVNVVWISHHSFVDLHSVQCARTKPKLWYMLLCELLENTQYSRNPLCFRSFRCPGIQSPTVRAREFHSFAIAAFCCVYAATTNAAYVGTTESIFC